MDSANQRVMPSPLIIRRQFSDVDEFAEAVNVHRQVQVNQLSLQAAQTLLLQAKFDQVQFVLLNSSCPLQVIGPKDPNFIEFACVVQTNGVELIAHKHGVASDSLFGFDSSREIDRV